jgi:pantetheine-phosphate adenylyltransferase
MYPGTFDPFTNGHEEMVRRAAKLFGRVVIAVAASPAKRPLFTLAERIALIRSVVGDVQEIEVIGYEGLTVEFARQVDVGVIIRGLRAVSDFEYEFQLATMNRHLAQDIETVFLTPTEEFMFVSSTLVREIAALGGEVAAFVNPAVDKALQRRRAGKTD